MKKVNLKLKVVKGRQRKVIREKLHNGNITLRVVGSEKRGFRVAGQVGHDVIPIGQTYPRQIDAVNYGEAKFGQKAKKAVGI